MLLSAQIETQKKFYEERIADIEQKSILKICVLEKELQDLIAGILFCYFLFMFYFIDFSRKK